MKIKIGTIQLGENSKYQLESPVSGLTAPDIRTGDGLYAGVDGGYVSSQLYGMRTIVLTGFYIGSDCEEADKLRLALMTNLHIRYLYPVFITTFSGKHYFTEGYITDIKSDLEGPRAGEFQITILCPDPIIYDGGDGLTTDSAWVEQVFYKEDPGGFHIKYQSPVKWISGQLVTNIENRGSVETYPIITLRGIFHSPTITNLTTNKFISIDRTFTETDEVIIDMKERIITLNGVSIAADRTVNSSWWTLLSGNNQVVLTTSDNDDTEFGMIKFKQGFEGI